MAEKAKDKDMTFDELCKEIKKMRPGAVMQFLAKQFGMNSTEFILNNCIDIAAKAAKEGWSKGSDVVKAVRDFREKNKEDKTNIDFSSMTIDEQSVQDTYMFDGKLGEQFKTYLDNYKRSMEETAKETEKAEEELKSDAKSRGVDMDKPELKDKEIAIASVIDNPKNKDDSGKELEKKAETADKVTEEIRKIKEENSKTAEEFSKIQVKPEDTKQAISDIKSGKADKQAKSGKSGKTDQQKRRDSIQKKIKAGVLKLAKSNDSVKDVKVSLLNKEALVKALEQKGFKKTIQKVQSIEFSRCALVGVSLVAQAKDKEEQKKDIVKVSGVLAKILKDNLGDSANGFDKIPCGKSVDGGYALYVIQPYDESSLKESEYLDGNAIDEAELNESSSVDVDDLASAVAAKVASIVKNSNMAKDKAEDLLEKWLYNTAGAVFKDSDNVESFISSAKDEFEDVFENGDKSVVYDTISDKAQQVADKMVSGNLAGGIDAYDPGKIAGMLKHAVDNTVSDDVSDKMAKLLKPIDTSDVKVEVGDNGFRLDGNAHNIMSGAILHQAFVDNNMDYQAQQDVFRLFSRSGSNAAMRMVKDKLQQDINVFLAGYDKNPEQMMKHLFTGHTPEQKDVLAELVAKIKPDSVKYAKALGVEVDGIVGNAKAAGSAAAEVISDDGIAGAVDGQIPLDQRGIAFSPTTMLNNLNQLDDMADDGLDPTEMKKVSEFGAQLADYQKWAVEHADSADPDIKSKIAQIQLVTGKYNEFLDDNSVKLDPERLGDVVPDGDEHAAKAVAAATIPGSAAQNAMEPAKSGWFGGAFTAFGWARLIAKSTAIALNQGKTVIDTFGAMAIKNKEDANVIAEMKFTAQNGQSSDTKFEDTQFSVRFDINDMKWHATNLDDRKMELPEDQIVKIALESEAGRKFKAKCVNAWSQIFGSDEQAKQAGVKQLIIASIDNKLGQKSDKEKLKFINTVKDFSRKFDEIKKKFA